MTKCRSSFESGTTRWAVRKAQWRALGILDSDMEKAQERDDQFIVGAVDLL
jgi:hypothetical protein